jgi:D-lactate dehydrogenase (quinone)
MSKTTTIDLSPGFLKGLARIAGVGCLLTDPADCWPYGYDNSRRHALPQAVVFASDEDADHGAGRLCRDAGPRSIARGRGTGTTGATVPDRGGIVLSFERMDAILRIAPEDRLAVVQPGVINERLQQAVGAFGFFWPPDPPARRAAPSGAISPTTRLVPGRSSTAPRARTRSDWTAISGRGERAAHGCADHQGRGGLRPHPTHHRLGGTLALITEATLKLTPLPEAKRTLRAAYADIHAAAAAVSAIMAQPVIPCALEIMDAAAIRTVQRLAGIDLPEGVGAS